MQTLGAVGVVVGVVVVVVDVLMLVPAKAIVANARSESLMVARRGLI